MEMFWKSVRTIVYVQFSSVIAIELYIHVPWAGVPWRAAEREPSAHLLTSPVRYTQRNTYTSGRQSHIYYC